MKLSVMKFGCTVAVVWALIVFSVGLTNLISPSYGVEFLKVMDSIYPGYHFGMWGFWGVLVATLYAALDALIIGFIFAWLYNRLTKGKS